MKKKSIAIVVAIIGVIISIIIGGQAMNYFDEISKIENLIAMHENRILNMQDELDTLCDDILSEYKIVDELDYTVYQRQQIYDRKICDYDKAIEELAFWRGEIPMRKIIFMDDGTEIQIIEHK